MASLESIDSLLPSEVLEDFCMSISDGIPADLGVIFDAYENDTFWLPPCDVEATTAADLPRLESTSWEKDQTFNASRKSGKVINDLYPLQLEFQGRNINQSTMVPTQHDINVRFQQLRCDPPLISSCQTANCQLPICICVDSLSRTMLACPTDYGSMGGGGTVDATEPLPDVFCTTDMHTWTQDDIQHVIRCTLTESHENAMQTVRPGMWPPKTKHRQTGTSATEPAMPLSAYNFFFRVERLRLLENARCNKSMDPQSQLAKSLSFYNRILSATAGGSSRRDFQDLVLGDQWRRDSSTKRRHRKSHGCISFHSLAKLVAQSWRVLPPHVKQVFQEISDRDFERYDLERLANLHATTTQTNREMAVFR